MLYLLSPDDFINPKVKAFGVISTSLVIVALLTQCLLILYQTTIKAASKLLLQEETLKTISKVEPI
ncbi:hypothetical protein SD81_009485 [Tolypothrix campylonemoides VB511288]|nr:hypothetical protein SD81_009485 [Tolypothrix campylonemoides VB511288]